MWARAFKDYPPDTKLVKEEVEPGRGIIGCEMHEINGWGDSLHIPRKKRHGLIAKLILALFGEH